MTGKTLAVSILFLLSTTSNSNVINVPKPPPPPPSIEQIWGDAGSQAMPLTAQSMKTRNGSGRVLDVRQKKYLRPFFGDLVDTTVIVYNAAMASELSFAGKSIKLTKVDAIGQSFCERIYVKNGYVPGDFLMLNLIAHELQHSLQCKQANQDIRKFGYKYYYEYKKANQSYENNSLEKEAYRIQSEFVDYMNNAYAGQRLKAEGNRCWRKASLRAFHQELRLKADFGGGGNVYFSGKKYDEFDNSFYLIDLECSGFKTGRPYLIAAGNSGEYLSYKSDLVLMADQLGYGSNEKFQIVSPFDDSLIENATNRASLLKSSGGKYLKIDSNGRYSFVVDRAQATWVNWQ